MAGKVSNDQDLCPYTRREYRHTSPLISLLESLIRRPCWEETGCNIGVRTKECKDWPENEDKVKHVLNIYSDYWKIVDEKNKKYYDILMTQYMEYKRDNVKFPPKIIKEVNSLSNITMMLIPRPDLQILKDGFTVPVDIELVKLRENTRKRIQESGSETRKIKRAN